MTRLNNTFLEDTEREYWTYQEDNYVILFPLKIQTSSTQDLQHQ